MKSLNMPSFLKFLHESKEMLDISILAADKYYKSTDKKEKLLRSPCTVEVKTDGVKLTAIKIADNGDLNDWILAYKNSILYHGEYGYQADTNVKSQSIGASQFKVALKHFASVGKTSIPVDTELQIEFLMSKPTLSSHYTKKHEMILIQYAPTTYNVKFGKLLSKPGTASTAKREKYAKELDIMAPEVLFKGVMSSPERFAEGIISPQLKKIWTSRKDVMDFSDPDKTYEQIKALFLEIPSAFGGTEEGVIIKNSDGIFKWQQDFQLDQAARLAIKMQYKDDNPDAETTYWNNVTAAAYNIIKGINTAKSDERNVSEMMKTLANKLRVYHPPFEHPKKTVVNIKDDIQLNAKTLLIKSLKGNNGCLVLGKFRVLTNGHYRLIMNALNRFDRVCVCVVSSKDSKKTEEMRIQMIRKTFGDKVDIITHSSGNIRSIIDKVDFNINGVYAGSDRVAAYARQVASSIGVEVIEMPRGVSSISATKVIEKIDNKAFFDDNVPDEIHDMYDEIKRVYSTSQS